MKFIVHTDGGARGNPGPAAVGVVIEEAISHQPSAISQTDAKSLKAEDRKLIAEFGKQIGETTNNVAEYTAVREALAYLRNNPIIQSSNNPIIQCFLDSNLVANQLNGLFKVKDSVLRELLSQIRILEQEIGGEITYTHVPRERNWRADWLVNKALDNF